MQFNAINLCGLAVVIIMLIPNIFYAARFRGVENKCKNRLMNTAEQIGRYSSFALMFLPIGVWEFGFAGLNEFFIYLFGNAALLLCYLITWVFYFKKQTMQRALALAVVPTLIFLLSGLTLRHWLLASASVVFGIGHIYVTYINNKKGR